MTATPQATPSTKSRIWIGWILSALPVLFLLLDSAMKLVSPAPVVAAMAQLGYSPNLSLPIGILLLLCVLLYVIPRTSALGAILLTGYLGAAIAAHVRVSNPLFSHTLFPLYVALPLWGGLFLREPRLRALFLQRG